MRGSSISLAAAFFAVCGFAGCGRGSGNAFDATRPAVPNVVLVSIDTLRADAISVHGGIAPTPQFQALADSATRFEWAFAPVPLSAPSHATLFTGQDVLRHAVTSNGVPLVQEISTLAEAFRAGGYRTAGFVSSWVLDHEHGFAQGFEHYSDTFAPEAGTMDPDRRYPGAIWSRDREGALDRRANATVATARWWLRDTQDDKRPFFLFLHIFDPHAPYLPPGVFKARSFQLPVALGDRGAPEVPAPLLERWIRLYAGEVMFVDDMLVPIRRFGTDFGAGRDTLLVVTADHGEGLGQHGEVEHGGHLYDEQLRIPLLFEWPGVIAAGRRIETPVALADVPVTILDLVGLPPLPGADGVSLAPALRGAAPPPPHPIFGFRRPHHHTETIQVSKSSVRADGWKYIRHSDGREELFDLTRDPREQHDLAATRVEIRTPLAALLDAHLGASPQPGVGGPAISDEDMARLRSIGYGR